MLNLSASYGSEKESSPVKAYIRYSNPDKEIRINCPVEKPGFILGIFNISLGRRKCNSRC